MRIYRFANTTERENGNVFEEQAFVFHIFLHRRHVYTLRRDRKIYIIEISRLFGSNGYINDVLRQRSNSKII